jgi:two-component system CheB/CheR fusion protein
LVEVEGQVRPIRIVVRPMSELREDSGLLAVIFQEHGPPAAASSHETSPTPAERAIVQHLEGELRIAREELQSAIEELESANEELRSSNEELITTNEELQSANEELQTSKEELQSANEELETVNAELNRRVAELDEANSDLQNFFACTEIATLFLDRDLRISRFTPAATGLFNLLESDVGRPIGDLAPKFTGMDLLADVEQVAQTLTTSEKQVKAAEGPAWFMVRILPYRSVDHVIAGVVVTFVDITALKRAEIGLRQSERRFATTFRASPAGILLADLSDGRIVDINEAGTAALGCSRDEALARTTIDFGLWLDEAERTEAIQQLQESDGHAWRKEVSLTWPSGEKRYLDVRFELIELENRPCFLVICNDITPYHETLDDLRNERKALLQLSEMHEHDRQLTVFEIHDGIAQMLFGAKCKLEALTKRWPADMPELRETLEAGLLLVRTAAHEARRLMSGLRPSELDTLGVAGAIKRWVADQQSREGPTVDFSHQLGGARLAPPLDNAVFRIVQEAVSNARRHSQSDRVQIELTRDGDWLRLRVEDWGVGFDASSPRKDSFGLRGIRERARLLDGRCDIDTAPGRGTRIVVELPFLEAVTAEAQQ